MSSNENENTPTIDEIELYQRSIAREWQRNRIIEGQKRARALDREMRERYGPMRPGPEEEPEMPGALTPEV